MGDVPKLETNKLDQFSHDLEKLTLDAPYKTLPNTEVSIPSFQRQGYMEKLGHSRKKWFKRFFVLRDSFLLSYNLDKSELTVEPRSCIHLASCKVQEMQHGTKACFFITTSEKDQFLFACPSTDERKAWMKDIQIARTITHANMVKLAVENQYLAEEKGLMGTTEDKSSSSLSLFSNKQYIKKTPLIGGAEGWLYTPGFNASYTNKGTGIFSNKVKWTKHYFILRDSNLLMFRGGDILTKPRGCMYLVGTETEAVEQKEDKNLFVFVCKSPKCGDVIELATHSEKYRKRWMNALKIGARVTYRDFKLLLKEHELFASFEVTVNGETQTVAKPPMIEDTDITGKQLDPGVMQAYSKDGKPLIRNPDGKLVDTSDGRVVESTEDRFNEQGEQLDPFNRPLPDGAVPMFTADKQPIGVGPDGEHYLPDGTVVDKSEAHFDVNGTELPQEVVGAAEKVAKDLDVAIKVRAHLQGEGAAAEAVDPLGRTFRQMKEDDKGMVVNADGDKVPIATARVMDQDDGNKMVDFKTFRAKETKTHRDLGVVPVEERKGTLKIMSEAGEEGKEQELGSLELEGMATLSDVRNMIQGDMIQEDFVFLNEDLPLSKAEETNKLALTLGESIVIRPRGGIKEVAAPTKFSSKLQEMTAYERQKQQEKLEFQNILKQIQSGSYLKPIEIPDDAE